MNNKDLLFEIAMDIRSEKNKRKKRKDKKSMTFKGVSINDVETTAEECGLCLTEFNKQCQSTWIVLFVEQIW